MNDVVRPIRWDRLNQQEAERVVREYAEDSANIIFGTHSLDREEERDISTTECLRILREGFVEPEPKMNKNGEWEVIVTKTLRTQRSASAVTIILREDKKLFVKTLMWRD